jgi:hypothetical protein
MRGPILQAYDTLGAEGGGTLFLGPGTFTINETIDFERYSNVTVEGAGMGLTILSLPPGPVGRFRADNGTPVGLYNSSLGGPVNGSTVNFIQVLGPTPINNFRLCDLTLDAQATSPTEDWSGSLLFDISGGNDHWYVDVGETNLFGASTVPNGIHLERSAQGNALAYGYRMEDLVAGPDAVPYQPLPGYHGGPNFLNLGGLVDCQISNVSGIGMVEFDLSPLSGCRLTDWNVTGHLLIDPNLAVSWNGTILQNVSADIQGTAAPDALDSALPPGASGTTFQGLLLRNDTFVGPVLGAGTLSQVYSSRFLGGLNSTPPVFVDDTVVYGNPGPDRIPLPIRVEGVPGNGSLLGSDTFLFPNGTRDQDPFLLASPVTTWRQDTLVLAGPTPGFLLSAPGLVLTAQSSFLDLTYEPQGGSSPPELTLVDLPGSPGFSDLGAYVGNLTGIIDDLPAQDLPVPSGLSLTYRGTTTVVLVWTAPAAGVTNYTVYLGDTPLSLDLRYSVGPQTWFRASSLEPGTQYYVAIQAWRGGVGSAMSAPVPFSTATPSAGGSPISLPWAVTVVVLLSAVVVAGILISLDPSRRVRSR